MGSLKKKTLFREGALYVPFLNEGERVQANGIRKDVSRFGNGSEHSKKDITKGVKRAKSRAVQNFNNRVNADKKVIAIGKQYHKAQFQIEIAERSTVEDPEAFLQAKERKAQRQADRENKKQLRRK